MFTACLPLDVRLSPGLDPELQTQVLHYGQALPVSAQYCSLVRSKLLIPVNGAWHCPLSSQACAVASARKGLGRKPEAGGMLGRDPLSDRCSSRIVLRSRV